MSFMKDVFEVDEFFEQTRIFKFTDDVVFKECFKDGESVLISFLQMFLPRGVRLSFMKIAERWNKPMERLHI